MDIIKSNNYQENLFLLLIFKSIPPHTLFTLKIKCFFLPFIPVIFIQTKKKKNLPILPKSEKTLFKNRQSIYSHSEKVCAVFSFGKPRHTRKT